MSKREAKYFPREVIEEPSYTDVIYDKMEMYKKAFEEKVREIVRLESKITKLEEDLKYETKLRHLGL